MSDKKITVTTTPKNRIVVNKGSGYSSIDTLIELRDVDAANVKNDDVLVYVSANGKFIFKEVPFVNSSFQTANAAFDKANAANVLAYTVGINANAWANTKVSSVTGTSGQIYSSGGTTPTLNLIATGVTARTYGAANQIPVFTVDAFGRLTSAANVAVEGMNYVYANSIGAASNAWANTVGTAGNNYSIAVGASSNAWANTVGTAGNNYSIAIGVAGNNYSIAVGASSNAWTNSINVYSDATYFRRSGGTISGSVTVVGNLGITGNLAVTGNTYFISTENYRVSDPLIYLAGNNYISDIVDIGFIANYVNTTGANVHTGLYREHENKEWYLFQGYDKEPDNNHIGAFSNNMTLAVLNSDLRTSNLTLGGTNAISWITSAFSKANNALANTSGVSFAGDLYFPTGNVGIGTAPSSSYKLDVNGPVASLIGKFVNRDSGNEISYLDRQTLSFTKDGVVRWSDWNSVGSGANFDTQLNRYSANTICIGNSTSNTSGRLLVGSIGIGTTTPTANLDVSTGGADAGFKVYKDHLTYIAGPGGQSCYWDNNGLAINSSVGRNYNLYVNGTGYFGGRLYLQSSIDFTAAGGEAAKISSPSSDVLVFSNSGGERMRIASGGNVGIGTASPSSKLQVNGTITIANTGPVESFRSGANNITLNMYNEANGTLSWEGSAGQLFSITNDLTGSIFSVNDVSGIPSIDVNANGNISLAQFSGNVGIGTSNPIYKLDVNGDARITGNLTLGDATTDTITVNAANFNLANNVSFDSGTLFIDKNNDRIGVGTTSPEQKLDVRGIVQISNGPWNAAYNGLKIDPDNRQMTFDWGSYASTITWASGPITWDTGQWGSLNLLGSQKITSTAAASLITALELVNTNGTSDTSATGILLRAGGNFAKGLIAFKNQTIWGVGDLIFGVNGAADNTTAGLSDEKMVIKGSTGNIGIGTSSPAQKLSVAGNASLIGEGSSRGLIVNGYSGVSTPTQYVTSLYSQLSAKGVLTFGNNGVNEIRAGATGAGGSLRIYVNNTVDGSTASSDGILSMAFDSAGNVGIGTSSPTAKLHVAGDAIFTGNVTVSGNTTYMNTQTLLIGDNLITLNADLPNNLPATEDAGIEVNRGAYGNASIVWDETNDRWDVRANSNNLVSILSTGNIGIGTSSPATKLHVKGDATIEYNGNASFPFKVTVGSDTNFGKISVGGSYIELPYENSVSPININGLLKTTSSKVTIDGNGGRNQTIPSGTTTFYLNANKSGLNGGHITIFGGDTPHNDPGVIPGNLYLGGGYAYLLGTYGDVTLQPNGGNVGIGIATATSKLHVVGTANITSGIVTTGDITTTGTMTAQHFDNVSDITLKENIEPIQDALNTLEKLNPVSFTWKKDGSTSFGLIAQEVEKILPEIVHQSDEVKTVSYTQIISLLIAAIKELNTKLDDLT